MLGALLMPAALLTPVQYFMPTWVLFMIVGIPQIMLVTAAYTMAGPVFQSVLPYRLRGLGSAFGGLYIFFIGATGGALLAAFLTNEFGVRVAVLVLLIPSTLVGGFLFFRSAAFVKSDLAVAAAEVKEELAEYERRQADPDSGSPSSAQEHRLLLRPSPSALWSFTGSPAGRSTGTGRYERSGEIVGAASHLRTRDTLEGCGPARRTDDHVRSPRTTGASRHSDGAPGARPPLAR